MVTVTFKAKGYDSSQLIPFTEPLKAELGSQVNVVTTNVRGIGIGESLTVSIVGSLTATAIIVIIKAMRKAYDGLDKPDCKMMVVEEETEERWIIPQEEGPCIEYYKKRKTKGLR